MSADPFYVSLVPALLELTFRCFKTDSSLARVQQVALELQTLTDKYSLHLPVFDAPTHFEEQKIWSHLLT